VTALANPEVGKYLSEHFVSTFQKVGTFRIVGRAKQGGNVASYFCAQDGRVLHVVAGPVDAATLLREAKWVVESAKKALAENKKSGKSIKEQFRALHAERLAREHGLAIEPVTIDAPAPSEKPALSYTDPTGKPLAPVLPPPPIEGPNVSFNKAGQEAAAKSPGARDIRDRNGKRWALGNQGRVHALMTAHSMKKIETLYGSVFEGILGEKVSTKPVQVTDPFPWHARGSRVPEAEIRQALLQLQVKELTE
jgi:hypothetical protein